MIQVPVTYSPPNPTGIEGASQDLTLTVAPRNHYSVRLTSNHPPYLVQDHGSVHTCAEVRQLYPLWESLGLYIFFLPKYCSQMNLIEEEWQRLKEDEIAGRMFDDEYDLAMAVIESIDSRSERRGYKAERFRFNR